MYFRTKAHEHNYIRQVMRHSNKCSNEYLSVLYLITADAILWKVSKKEITDKDIAIGRIDLHGIDAMGYILIKIASDIQNRSRYITMKDLCDKYLISNKTYELIFTAIQICRDGYNALDCIDKKFM